MARLITAPSPTVECVFPRILEYSATMLAFHAPPGAVTNPSPYMSEELSRQRLAQDLRELDEKDLLVEEMVYER